MTVPLPAWRDELGLSAALWAGRGRHAVERHRWVAFSRAPSVDYNVVVCHGPGVVSRTIADVTAEGVPTVIMLADTSLGGAQLLVDAGWVCIGAQPFMGRDATGCSLDAAVTHVGADRLPEVRAVVARAFDISPELAAVALPAELVTRPGWAAWALSESGEVRAALATVRVGAGLAIWSMATPPLWQRRGYGRRLLSGVLAHGAIEGVDHSILYASAAGEPFYRAFGFAILEHWQLWSRPRWVLGYA